MKTQTTKQVIVNHPYGTTRARRAVPVWLATLALVAGLASSARATSYTNAASGNWSSTSTWSPNTGTPGTGDSAAIYNTGNRSITVDVTRTISALTIGSGAYGSANWNLYDNGGGNSLTMGTLNIESYGTLRPGLTLNVTNSGYWSGTDGNANFLGGTINILNGATFNLPVRLEPSGTTGLFSVQSGGTVTLSGNYINYNQSPNLTFNIDGTANFTQPGTLQNNAKLFTGDGTWNINSAGALRFGAGSNGSFALTPGTASWTGNSGTVVFSVSGGTGTNVLGAFSMGGSNTLDFNNGYYQINRASTFQDVIVRGSTTLDLNQSGSPVTHTVNGTLNPNGTSWNLLSTGAASTLSVATLNISSYGTIGSNLTVNVTGGGNFGDPNDANWLYGTLNIKSGATFTVSAMRYRGGTGDFNVESGGTLTINGGYGFNTGYSAEPNLSFDNDGTVKFNSAGNFYQNAIIVTGGGTWRMDNSGTLNFNKGASGSIALNPSTALWAGNSGMVNFNVSGGTGTNTLGAFNMGGSNALRFQGGYYEINRASTFGNIEMPGTATLDLNPADASPVTHTIDGSLLISGNAVQILKSTSPAGAIVYVAGLSSGSLNHFDIGTNVTVNLTGAGSMGGAYQDIYGAFNVNNGATFTLAGSNNRLRGNGAFNVEPGGTVNINGGHSINFYDGGATGMTFTNNGTVNVNYSGTYTHNSKTVAGTGSWKVTTANLVFDGGASQIEGWGGSGAFNNNATWHAVGTGYINFPGGSANSIATIGPNATIIVENGGRIQEFNDTARNALTVNGALHVRGTSVLAFNSGQNLTIASGGTLGGNGTISSGGSSTVFIQNGGTVSPGASPGTLTVPDLMLAAGGVYRYEGFDLLAVTGQLTLSNDWVLAMIQNGRIADSGSLTLFTFGTTNAAPAAFDLTPVMVGTNATELGFVPMGPVYLDVVGNSLVLFGLQAVPEPAVLLLLLGGGLVLVRARRARR